MTGTVPVGTPTGTPALPALPDAALRAVAPLLREIGDLKRVRTADGPRSGAERAFLAAWGALVAGEEAAQVADRVCAAALAGARLAGVDAAVLRRCGLDAAETEAVLRGSAAAHRAVLDPVTYARLTAALPSLAAETGGEGREVPEFAVALCAQPRAGATRPGHPRLMAEPPESHADHCWAVAVYGGLLADVFEADPGEVFVVGLAHHLHNAVLPDAGFAGEELLGAYLPRVEAETRARALRVLPGRLAGRVDRLLAQVRDRVDTPLARAFHAADVLDRVLQVRHHARAAAFTSEQALEDMQLVHDSPVSGFHHDVLRAAEPA